MSTILQTISSLPNLWSLREKEISAAERDLGIRFTDEYREYVAAFGVITAKGVELTGIADSKDHNVVSVTRTAWELNPDVPHTMYVIERAYFDGIFIWQESSDGVIYQTSPNAKPEEIAKTLTEYIGRRTDKKSNHL